MVSNKVFQSINALLALVAAFTVALTFYSCSRFYTYLPTSDTWIYTDFLAQAAQGQLDITALFEKHNGVHLIALPKLVYFFDMWLGNGTGLLTTLTSLMAMLATSIIFITIISRITTINRQEKISLGLASSIFLMSACQAESLMNPANLQWSLLVFSATLSAWFFYSYTLKKSVLNIIGVFAGLTLVSLTSASPLLIVVPLSLFVLRNKITGRAVLAVIILTLMIIGAGGVFFSDYRPLIPVLLAGWLKFTIDFLAPPIERLSWMLASIVAGALCFFALFKLVKTKFNFEEKEAGFFALLLAFSLFVIFTIGVARSYSPTAFTFRFVNIGLLFNATLFPLLYLSTKPQPLLRAFITPVVLIYVGVLSYVNITEASAYGYGRNHMKLTQVAHALDINDPFVVAAMPGTMWEKQDFDYVQTHKNLLKDAQTGIYGSDQFKHVGQSIDVLANLASTNCNTKIIKMRRLLPDQAAYRLLGTSKTESGKVFSRVYFVDEKNIIRGFAIPIEPNKNILKGLFEDEQWAGFINFETASLDANVAQQSLTLYAYNKHEICQGEKIQLPEYIKPTKKQSEHGQEPQ